MKEFFYEWSQDIYLLHIEMVSNSKLVEYTICRINDLEEMAQHYSIMSINGAYRFIVSRKTNKEKSVVIKYDNNVILKAFLVYDRAFYPTTPFFEQ